LVAGVGLILCARAGFAASPRLVVWEAMFQLGIIVVALGFLISLLRYRLFDAETVISRSAAYATLTLALVATFGGSEALIQNIGQDYLGMNLGSVSGGMAAAVAAVLLNPLHERITRWAEARFQPDLTYLKRELPDLVARFATSSSTRRLSKAALPLINNAIHATHSALVVDGKVEGACGITLEDARRWAVEYLKPGYSDRDETDRIFPLRLNLGLVAPDAAALLVLGPRPDGTLCGKEDLDAVRSILPAFRDAIMMTVSRETLDAAIDRRESSLRIEIVGINARLDALESSAVDPRVRGERYQAR